MQRVKDREKQTQDNTGTYYQRENRRTRQKTSLPPSKRLNDPLGNQLGYMNSNRPSKPNLPDAPKPSKLLAPTGLRLILSSLSYRIPQLAHCIKQNELVLS